MRYVNFNQLRSFHAVALTGNVTSAARLLFVSQPTVTTQLKQLEEKYGVELVFRMHRGIKLTPLGEVLYKLTMRIFALEEEALNVLKDASSLDIGQLSIGAVGPFFSMKLITEYNRIYPGVKVSLTTSNSSKILKKLLNFEVDVAVIGNVEANPLLTIYPISKHPIVLLVGKSHPWFDKKSAKLTELENMKVVYREEGSETRKVLETALEKKGVTPSIVMEVNREAVREAALQGLGIGIISLAEFRPGENLHMIPIADCDIFTEAFIVCLKERADMHKIKMFLNLSSLNNPFG
jgi:LysR family transcriptional regulator, low CO2-responsive transcriptional regulator